MGGHAVTSRRVFYESFFFFPGLSGPKAGTAQIQGMRSLTLQGDLGLHWVSVLIHWRPVASGAWPNLLQVVTKSQGRSRLIMEE